MADIIVQSENGTQAIIQTGSTIQAVVATAPAVNFIVSGTLKGEKGDTSAGAADATTTSKGLIQLAGDLGGTAASPTVPGLATKGPKLPTYTVGAAGDFTTIQAALDAATSGGTIYLIDNSYTITSTLLIKSSDVTIIGNGAKTVISCNGATVTTLIKSNSTTYARFKLKNVELYQSNATIQGIAIDGSNMALCVYEGLVIANFGTAVKLNDTVNLTFYNRFADIFITGCNNGIDITSTNPVNDNMFMNIRTSLVAGGAGKGLKITKGQSNNFYNCNFESGAGTGITGISLEPTVFGDVYDTNFYGVYVEGNATNVSINSNTVRTNFFGGQIVAGLTADVVDTGSNTQFWGADVGYALKNQLSAMSWLDATSTSATLISLKNNTSFAHVGGNLVKAQMLNGTDTSNVIRIENAGTGKSISGTNGTTETFSVDKAGAILSAGVAVPTVASTDTITGIKTFNAGTLLDKGTQVFNVKAYGAVCNGSTDDTTAIQAALDAAATAGSGTVLIPANAVVSNILIGSYVTLAGASKATTLIGKSGATGFMVALKTPASTQRITVRDLTIKPNQTGLGGIKLDNTGATVDTLHTLENVTVTNSVLDAFYFGNNIRELRATNCVAYFTTGGSGFNIQGGATDNHFTDCTVGVSSDQAWQIYGNNNMFQGCKAFFGGYNGSTWASGKSGFYISGTSYNTFVNCQSQQNASHGFDLQTNNRLAVVGCDTDTNNAGNFGGVGINTSANTYSVISNNVGGNNSGITPGSQVYGIQVAGTQTGTLFIGNAVGGASGSLNYVSGTGYMYISADVTDFTNVPVKFTQLQLTTGAGASKVLTSDGSGNATWQTPTGGSGSGIVRSVSTISANTSAGSTATTDYVYICTGSTGYTLTLPTAVGNTNRYTVKNGSTANQTLATTSAQTVDGSASATLTPNTSLDLISDGTNWRTI